MSSKIGHRLLAEWLFRFAVLALAFFWLVSPPAGATPDARPATPEERAR